jgi:uncharacterized protein YbjT (DUF2867 family)
MVNALAWASSIKARGIVNAATGVGKIAFIHPRDIADVATMALTTESYAGESLAISGPTALSYQEMTATIGAVIGKSLRFEPISDEEVSRRMVAAGEAPESVEYHLSIFRAIRDGHLATVTDGVQRVLGRAPISFEQWVRENAAAFC